MRTIYLDHAATTPVHPDVLQAMLPYFNEAFGNPSTVYGLGRRAREAVDAARESVAASLGARPADIVFTAGGTESDNAALRGVALASKAEGTHIVSTAGEHHAVLHTIEHLEHFGFNATIVPIDEFAMVDPEEFAAAAGSQTVIASVMLANNEVGTIQPVAEIARRLRALRHRIPLHTDAVQAPGDVAINVDELGVDLLSISAHKFGGPKGVGALYIRKGTPFQPQEHGGSQERNRRAGTENVPGIVGLAAALAMATRNRVAWSTQIAALRDRLVQGTLAAIPGARLNGHPTQRLANSASFSLDGVDNDALLAALDMHGVAASIGSACTAASLEPSHVLTAMGLSADMARTTVRFTLGPGTTADDIDTVLRVLPTVVERLRDPARQGAAA